MAQAGVMRTAIDERYRISSYLPHRLKSKVALILLTGFATFAARHIYQSFGTKPGEAPSNAGAGEEGAVSTGRLNLLQNRGITPAPIIDEVKNGDVAAADKRTVKIAEDEATLRQRQAVIEGVEHNNEESIGS